MAQITAGGRVSVFARRCNSSELLRSRAAHRNSIASSFIERRWGARKACILSALSSEVEVSDEKAEGQSLKGEGVTPKSEDYSRWYLDVIREAELADYGPVRGTMVIRPYGYGIWELLQQSLDARFKEMGVKNAYFPQLIPMSFLTKEADHVEGFAPELAIVTKGGGKELEEPLAVRPTSETIINHMFTQWINSHRDLPLLINQWANVIRWEMRTRPFLRTLEFLWQEGHTAHSTGKEAEDMTLAMVRLYAEIATDFAAMPVVIGRKSEIEKFAGAEATYTIEAMMGDGKALQSGTSHYLGQNFSRAFNTQYQTSDGQQEFVYQSSWGMSTRMVGGLIMCHGDDVGLRLPPRLAPIQVIIVPIWVKDAEKESILEATLSVAKTLKESGLRVEIDDSDQKKPGWKFNFWEMKGVPVRIELGPKDLAKQCVVVSRRDKPGKEGKTFGIPMNPETLPGYVREVLDSIHSSYFEKASAFRDSNIVDVSSYDELKAAIDQNKWARGGWSGGPEEEKKVKEETGATLRCFPLDQPTEVPNCFLTGNSASEVALFAKAY